MSNDRTVLLSDQDSPARFGIGVGGWQYYVETPDLEPAFFADPRPRDQILAELGQSGTVRFQGVTTRDQNGAAKLVGGGVFSLKPGSAFVLRYADGFNELCGAAARHAAGEDDDGDDEEPAAPPPRSAPRPPPKPILGLGPQG